MAHFYGVTGLQRQLNLAGEADGGGFIVGVAWLWSYLLARYIYWQANLSNE